MKSMKVTEEQSPESSMENLKIEELNAKEAYESFLMYRRWYERTCWLSENDVENLNRTQESVEVKYYELRLKVLNLEIF